MKSLNFGLVIQYASLLTISAWAIGCAHHRCDQHDKNRPDLVYASAHLAPTKGSKVSGKVNFVEEFGKLKVTADVTGLEPNSKHGFHIHEFGDCTAADGASAGGHYNPQAHNHGAPESENHHAGDLGNISADAKGNAHLVIEITGVSLGGMINPIVGRAVIVHINNDDLTSQPVGAAGARVACGVIGASNKNN